MNYVDDKAARQKAELYRIYEKDRRDFERRGLTLNVAFLERQKADIEDWFKRKNLSLDDFLEFDFA